MNIDFYFDVCNGMILNNFFATTDPGPKIKGFIRYKVSVNVPDPNKPDVVLVGELEEVEGEKDNG